MKSTHVFFWLVMGLGACGSGTPSLPGPTDGPAVVADAAPAPPDAAAVVADAASTAGDSAAMFGCNPLGFWRLSYFASSGLQTDERMQVDVDAAGKAIVTFPGRMVPPDSCSPTPRPGTQKIVADLSADRCILTLSRDENWCFSGEAQCSKLRVMLNFAVGSANARGPGTSCRCWEASSMSCTPKTFDAAAMRVP